MKLVKSIILLVAVAALTACLFELKHAVGGTAAGVRGTGLVLQDNLTNDLGVAASGTFTFSLRLTKRTTYSVTVKTQPSNPAQTCTVHNGSGTMGTSDVTNVLVTCTQAGRYAYVANQTDSTISAFTIDSTNGFLRPITGSPFAALGAAPVALAVDPNGSFLYVVNSGSNKVGVFAINDATGALTAATSTIYTGSGPTAIAVAPGGNFAYVANAAANTVSAFSIQRGVATAVGGSPYAAGNQPVALQIDPSGKFLYVTNFADGDVAAFAIDSATGALTSISGSPFASGLGAVSIAIDPSGIYAYVANRTAGTISLFSANTATGALAPISGSPLSTVTVPESITVDPTGSFVFAANVTSNNDVASYTITPSSGFLTLSSTASAGLSPVAVAADPAGKFVYAANNVSRSVSVFSVDSATGALTAVSGSPFAAGSGARSIAID